MNRAQNPRGPQAASTRTSPRPIPTFPIVGIGASAGGLEAFTELLKNLPCDTGMAFVLIQHLSRDHESALTEILARSTAMPVSEITDGTPVQPDHVYIIPPNANLIFDQGFLKLTPRSDAGMPTRPIDHFLKSLAENHGDCCIGIILSGTANDGTLGLQYIKEAGGITFAQDVSAKYEGMPHSAVASGTVDLVLAPAAIAEELTRISRSSYASLTEIVRSNTAALAEQPQGGGGNPFNEILALLRNQTRVDFSFYKPATIRRRIERRIVLNKLESLEDYLQLLRENAVELQSLYQDLLINVTSFFRDPGAFELLQQTIFPLLLEQRAQDDPVRIWVVGCSTGQEVYSIAMSYLEVAGDGNIPFKIFATDVDEPALGKARSGIYTESQVQELSPQRLRRFFVEVAGGYRIIDAIREACVFARHNVVRDPPFSRMDLVSCRNLLIYLEPLVQKKVLPVFHYALKAQGFLLLGMSETIGGFEDLFAAKDSKFRLFAKKPGAGRAQLAIPLRSHEMKMETQASDHTENTPLRFDPQKEADRICLARYVPAGVLIDADMEIIQFRGKTGAYLEPAPGKSSHNLLKMARGGLLLPLRDAIQKAQTEDVPTKMEGVRVEQENGYILIDLEVLPLRNLPASQRCFLVFFHPADQASGTGNAAGGPQGGTQQPSSGAAGNLPDEFARLKLELAETKDYLRSVIERHEAVDEELQAAGEEMQSSNEELQSMNEELETSREEIQATNEELTTLNEELNTRNREAGRLNDDVNNLLNSVAISVVIAGADFRIRRITPTAEKILNIRPQDIGRSLSEIRLGIDVPSLEGMMAETIETVSAREREVQNGQGCWFLLQIRPYITLDRKIDGVVLIFTDVDALKRSQLQIKAACDYAESILRTAPNPLLVLNAELRVETANQAFHDTFQTSPAESSGRLIYELGDGQWNIPELRQLLGKILPENRVFNDYEVTHDFGNIGRRTMLLNARTLEESGGEPARIVLGIQDITSRTRAEEQINTLNRELEDRVQVRTRELQEAVTALKNEIEERQRLEREILEISEREQCRLGQDLHDGLGQELSGIAMLGDVLTKQLRTETNPLADTAQKLTSYVREALDSARRLAKGHYPVELKRHGLLIALQDLADQTSQRTGIHCELRHDGPDLPLEQSAQIHIYRIIQECVGNAVKHARANQIIIESKTESGTHTFSVTDDGGGFVTEAESSGMGLHLMRYRARMIDAELNIEQPAEGGCRIACILTVR